MAKLKELREQAQKIAEDARSILDGIAPDTPEDKRKEAEAEFDRRMAEFDRLKAEIDRREKLEAAQRELEERLEREERAARDSKRPVEPIEAPAQRAGDGSSEYREVFAKVLRAGGNVAMLTEEERDVLVRAGGEARALSTGTGTAGGFTVPTTMASFIDEAMAATGPMYGDLPSVLQTTSGEIIQIPTVDYTAVTAAVKAEGASPADTGGSDPTFGQKSLGAYVYSSEWVNVSRELLQDSILNMESFLGRLLGEMLGRTANAVLTTGSGTGEPEGIVTAAAAGVTAASSSAITADELIDLYHSVDPAYRGSPRVRWMMSDGVAAIIRKLKDSTGRYLWNEDLTTGQPATLLGVPVVINQAMPAAPAIGAKTVLFGDFARYYVRKVGGPIVSVDSVSKAVAPNVAMAGHLRFDGRLVNRGAVKMLQHP